jgi:hypothetical protein
MTKGMFLIEKECYEEIDLSLVELLSLLKGINEINIDCINFKIKKCLGGDLKFLALMYGLNAANSKRACIWCDCDFTESLDIEKTWNITRSQKTANELVDQKDNKGHKFSPLFDDIEFCDCIIDILHLYLRITDKLFQHLINQIILSDGKESESLNIKKRKNFRALVNFVQIDCKVTKAFYVSKKSDTKYKMRSLNANERNKILNKIKDEENILTRIFPELRKAKQFQSVFKQFQNIILRIKTNENLHEEKRNQKLSQDLKYWLTNYLSLQPTEDNKITPYIHAFVFHMPEFIRMHGSINKYNVQGLEKLNDFTTQYYHHCTNKHKKDNSFVKQMLNHRNRTEFFILDGKENELN